MNLFAMMKQKNLKKYINVWLQINFRVRQKLSIPQQVVWTYWGSDEKFWLF